MHPCHIIYTLREEWRILPGNPLLEDSDHTPTNGNWRPDRAPLPFHEHLPNRLRKAIRSAKAPLLVLQPQGTLVPRSRKGPKNELSLGYIATSEGRNVLFRVKELPLYL